MMKSIRWMMVLLCVCLLLSSQGWAESDPAGEWPREITVSDGVIVMYQPQPEKLEGNRLRGRAAVAVELKNSAEPVFGAIWFQARLDTDRADRTATILDFSVTQVRFPEQNKEKSKKLKALLEKEIPKWQLEISMDRLMATLELAEQRSKSSQKIDTKPPKILFVPEPAILITLDGEPRLQEVENSELMRVINTPFTLLAETSRKTYYLYADTDTWYTANNLEGDWTVAKKVPPEVAALAPKAEAETDEELDPKEGDEPGPPPRIFVATEPTELISSNGKPEYTPISGTDLLYMSNTDSDVLLHTGSQKYYVLLAGRWYASAKLEGPWRYVPGDKLPPDFAKIPEDSEMGTVLYAVPGTDIAKEAVLDAQIPQTAAIDPKKATLTVEYDGDPKLEKIKNTKMEYAVNTATPVIFVNRKFYACDEAVWFVADGATGPWRVATFVPDEIYTIPPESPLYYVTFVRIYNATPEVVYVGYTPGYTNTYVYYNTIVYGTGYWYPGWYGHWYYPRPATWGFHVRWNPWTGFRFGFSYGWGPFRFTIGGGRWHRGGWWGPGRHRGYRAGYRHGYRRGRNAGYRAGYRAGHRDSSRENIYRNRRNQARTTAPSATPSSRVKAGGASKRANNVYADRNGNVHRKTDKGWEKRTKEGWQSERGRPGQMGKSRPEQTVKSQSRQTKQSHRSVSGTGKSSRSHQLDRSYKARQRGDQRARSFSQSRWKSGGGRGGGRGGRR